MSKTSLIINTACMDPLVRPNVNPYRSETYATRKDLILETVSKLKGQYDEIIIAGTFEPGDGYTYIEVYPHYRDRRDALYQREYGARHSSGDVLVFCHDDHTPAEDFALQLRRHYLEGYACNLTDDAPNPDCKCGKWHRPPEWDLIIPKRIHGLTGEELNNGKADDYMGGHCLVMRRSLWAEVSWLSVDTEFWDVSMTRLWREAGGILLWSDHLVHIDLEATEHER